MKRCPKCLSTYTDDSLAFCLQDGAKLLPVSNPSLSSEETLQLSSGRTTGSEPPPTEIMRPEDMPTARIESGASTQGQPRARATAVEGSASAAPPVYGSTPPAPRRSNAALVALSVIVAILLLVLGGLITWMMMRERRRERAGTNSTITTSNSNQSEANTEPTRTANANAKATPTPQPSPVDMAAAQKEVQAVLDAWAASVRQRNLEEHMKYYAETLEVYYNATNVSRDRVRTERNAAFSKYDTMEMQLSNVKISIEPSGTRATATFDKTFAFYGDKEFSGSGLSRFWLVKTGGRWRIVGEKDLQTYYVNK